MDNLRIPLMDVSGRIWTFQYITPDGTKFFRSRGRKNGCFFVLGNLTDSVKIYICEGYATGATTYECTSVPTVVAFDAGNVYSVTENIRKTYPTAQIIICANNDAYSDTNTGLTKAQYAARKFSAIVKFPIFKDISSKPTDFNDLFILEGKDAAITQLTIPAESKKITFNNNIENINTLNGFYISDDALMYFDESKKKYVKICNPIKVIALTSELEDDNAGCLVEFTDRTGETKKVKIFDAWLAKDGSKIHDILYKYGLDIETTPKAKKKLNEYLNSVNPSRLITYTIRSGWHGKCFLTALEAYGKPDKANRLIIHTSASEPAKISSSRTLKQWQDNVSALCINNSRLMLAVSATFASMMLTPCRANSFFLHFYGRSSQGKTTMLDVAASVFGNHSYTRTWRMTDNGLEGIAMAHNDLCLFLDEISECDPYKIGAMAYMLVNGFGKTRANTNGFSRRVLRWILGGISTGEEQLSDIIKATGKKPKAGQLLRILSIPAVPENGFGIFEDIHNSSSPADCATQLKEASQTYYGTAFPAFIRSVIEHYNDILPFYKTEMLQAKERFLPLRASAQDFRAFNTFATCGIGGLLATKLGITVWNNVDIMDSVMKNFISWLDNKNGVGNQEDIQVLTQIRLFFEKYAESRFQLIDTDNFVLDRSPFERAGFRAYRNDGMLFYVFKSYFEEIIAKGLELKYVKNLLRDKGILEVDKDHSRFDKVVRICNSLTRMYVINSKIFEGD